MEYEIKPHEKLSLGIKELWQYRELFFFFTWRDIKIKYKQTVLGFAWAVLQPIIMMLIFSAVGSAFNIPKAGIPRPLFVYSGLLLWNIFASGITNAGNSMVSNANIIKKIYFPRLIIPISSVLVALFDFIMTFTVFIAMLIYYFVTGQIHIDIVAFMVSVLLFLSPVMYPISGSHFVWAKYLFALNPLYRAIALFRTTFSDSTLHIYLVLISLASSLFLFVAGVFYFRKTEAYFADMA